MQTTLPRLAIDEKANLLETWAHEHHFRHHWRATPHRPRRPRPDRAAPRRPPPPPSAAAAHRSRPVRRLAGHDGARSPRPGALGRVALRLHPARADDDRPGRGAVQLRGAGALDPAEGEDRKSTRLNSSHLVISYAVF